MVEFGEQLRRAREAKGITQQTLAEQLYVTRQTVSRWECGDRYPDLITTTKISQILEVSLDDLLSGKEMTKVVERNPVVENKVANNIMIVLYAFVVISYLIPLVEILIGLPRVFNEDLVSTEYFSPIQILAFLLSIGVFTYGLVYAIKGMLSPKRMGLVLIAFYAGSCMERINYILETVNEGIWSWQSILSICIWDFLPNIVAALASYFFFFKRDNSKKWICLIGIASVWRLIYKFYSFVLIINDIRPNAGDFFSESLALDIVMAIVIYGLIMYQTYTLYKKRKIVLEE